MRCGRVLLELMQCRQDGQSVLCQGGCPCHASQDKLNACGLFQLDYTLHKESVLSQGGCPCCSSQDKLNACGLFWLDCTLHKAFTSVVSVACTNIIWLFRCYLPTTFKLQMILKSYFWNCWPRLFFLLSYYCYSFGKQIHSLALCICVSLLSLLSSF